jgi:GT2 family glycosyltransferase
VNKVGGIRSEIVEQYDYDLVLRCASGIMPERIRHIPRILYHRGVQDAAHAAKSGAVHAPLQSETTSSGWESGRQAIKEFLNKSGVHARVERTGRENYQVAYALPLKPLRLSILLPSRCEPHLIEPCLKSLLTQTTYAHYEVLLLVADRHRPAADAVQALTQFANSSRVRVLSYPDQPFNYSWVNNWAVSHVTGEFLCFLNDDTTVITSDWLERLVARACQPGVAAVGPMLRYYDDSVQHAGVILGLGGVAGHAFHGLPKGHCGYLDRACLEQDASCLTAACLVLRRDIFQDLGGFDEELPIAYNDVDLCLRLRKAGWRLIWTPTVELYHHESASAGRHDSPHRREEFKAAVALMRERWGADLDQDPYYNPNLSLRNAYHLAFPPRLLHRR